MTPPAEAHRKPQLVLTPGYPTVADLGQPAGNGDPHAELVAHAEAMLRASRAPIHPGVVDYPTLLRLGRELLVAIGEDPDRAGIADTPRRFADSWREFMAYDPGTVATAFSHHTSDDLVLVKGMRVWSMCEHHLLPFWADVAVAYRPKGTVLGLSKFARLAHKAAHRLQLQERLAADLADDIQRLAKTDDVAVIVTGEHTCMVMRGIRTEGTMTTSVLRGAFRAEHPARTELFALLRP